MVYRDLAKAVRLESNQTVCRLFGVTPQTVSKWRKALGVPQNNPGTLRRRVEHGTSPRGQKALKAMWAKACDPVRRAKIAAAKIGKRRPAHVGEAVRKAHLGKPLSAETRAKMREAQQRRRLVETLR